MLESENRNNIFLASGIAVSAALAWFCATKHRETTELARLLHDVAKKGPQLARRLHAIESQISSESEQGLETNRLIQDLKQQFEIHFDELSERISRCDESVKKEVERHRVETQNVRDETQNELDGVIQTNEQFLRATLEAQTAQMTDRVEMAELAAKVHVAEQLSGEVKQLMGKFDRLKIFVANNLAKVQGRGKKSRRRTGSDSYSSTSDRSSRMGDSTPESV